MKSLFILGMVLLSANAFAGNEKGNGGGIHYCPANKTQELYDIYEGQARYGYELTDRKLSVEQFIQFAIKRIGDANPYIGRLVKEQIDYLKQGHMIIRPSVKLTPIGDAKILLVDEGCEYKQLANWDEVSGNLLVNKNYFDQLNDLNKAALYIHEALYKVGRDLDLLEKVADGTTTSDEIRPMVGEVFSNAESLKKIWQVKDPEEVKKQAEATTAPYRKTLNDIQKACEEAEVIYSKYANELIENNYKVSSITPFVKAGTNLFSLYVSLEIEAEDQRDDDSLSSSYRAEAGEIAFNAFDKERAYKFRNDEILRKIFNK
jgi:hypothetical protein